MTALDWGYNVDETANKLMEVSSKARENGERYAIRTVGNAAAAVERKGQGQSRRMKKTEILTAVDIAEASLARGEGRTVTQESMRQLASEVKQHGRSRVAAGRGRQRGRG